MYNEDKIISQISMRNLLQCLQCEADILLVCTDQQSIKITPIFLHVLDYCYNFQHLVTLYSNAAIHFKNTDIHIDNIQQHTSIILHAIPFMKIFEAYNYNISAMMDEAKENLKKKILEKLSHSNMILSYLENQKSCGEIVPKFFADQLIKFYGLAIQSGSHEYFTMIGEIVIVHYILSEKIQELIVLLTCVQSFFGVFYSNSKLFKKHFQQLSLLAFQNLKTFQVLPDSGIINIIQNFYQMVESAQDKDIKIHLLNSLNALLNSIGFTLSLPIQLGSQEENQQRYNDLIDNLFLFKPLNGKEEEEEASYPRILDLFEQSISLLKTIDKSFENPDEVTILSNLVMNFETYSYNNLEKLIRIFLNTGIQLRMRGESVVSELSGIWAGYRLAEKTLDDYFVNNISNFSLSKDTENSAYMTYRELDICLWWAWSVKDRFDGSFYDYLMLCLRKFAGVIFLLLDQKFFTSALNSIKGTKIRLFLQNLPKQAILVLKTSEQYNPIFLTKMQLTCRTCGILPIIQGRVTPVTTEENELSEMQKQHRDFENFYVEEILNLQLTNLCRLFEEIQNNPELKNMIEITYQLLVNHTNRSRLSELSGLYFKVLLNNKLLPQAYQQVPKLIYRVLFEVFAKPQEYNTEDSRNNHANLTFMFHPVFLTIDINSYQNDPQGTEFAVGCITTLVYKLGEAIQVLMKEVKEFEFKKNERLRNEAMLLGLYGKMLRFSEVFQQILPYFGDLTNLLVLRKQEDKLKKLSQAINLIVMNPLLQMISPIAVNYILSVMKGIYAVDSSTFLITTTDMLMDNFMKAIAKLGETFVKLKREGDHQGISCLKKIILRQDNFWQKVVDHQSEAFENLGQEAVFAVFTLHIINQFLEKYLINLPISNETSSKLVKSLDQILNVNSDLVLLLNMEPTTESYLELSLDSQDNLYTKLVLNNIVPLLLIIKSNNTNQTLQSYLSQTLDSDKLLSVAMRERFDLLYKQLCSLDMVLKIFVEGQAFFEVFVIQNKLLVPTLAWISNILLRYKAIIGEEPVNIPILDKTIGHFVRLVNMNLRSLHERYSELNKVTAVNQARLSERYYINFLRDLFAGGPWFYEECYPNSYVLESLFRGLLGIASKMLDYKPLFDSSLPTEDQESRRLELNESDFKDPELFRRVRFSVKQMLEQCMSSPRFIQEFLPRRRILDIFEDNDLDEINGWLLGLMASTFKKITQQIETGVIQNQKDLFMALNLMNHLMDKSIKIPNMAILMEGFEEFNSQFLKNLQEVTKDFIESISFEKIKNMKEKLYFRPFISRYWALVVRLYRNLETVYKGDELGNIDNKTSEKLMQYLELGVSQFDLMSQLDVRRHMEGLTRSLLQQICLFMRLLWRRGERACLAKVIEKPTFLVLLLENFADEAGLEFLASFFSLHLINAFPFKEQVDMLIKGMRQANISRVENNYRIRVCQNFLQNKDPIESYVTEKEAFDMQYLMYGMNSSIKRTLDRFIEIYLHWLADDIQEISQGKPSSSKAVRPFFMLILFLKKLPELSPYILSYPIHLKKYNFSGLCIPGDFPDSVNFLQFIAHFHFFAYPWLGLTELAVSRATDQYILVKLEEQEKSVLLQELIPQLFLNEFVKVIDSRLKNGTLKDPENIWRLSVYITKALDFAMYSGENHNPSSSKVHKERLQSQLLEHFLSWIRLMGRESSLGNQTMMSYLLQNLKKLIESIMVYEYNVRVKKLKSNQYLRLDPGKTQTTTKLLKFLKLIAKKSKVGYSGEEDDERSQDGKKNHEFMEQILQRKNPPAEFLAHDVNQFEIIRKGLEQSKWKPQGGKATTGGGGDLSSNFEPLNGVIEKIDSFWNEAKRNKEFREFIGGVKETDKMNMGLKKQLRRYILLSWKSELTQLTSQDLQERRGDIYYPNSGPKKERGNEPILDVTKLKTREEEDFEEMEGVKKAWENETTRQLYPKSFIDKVIEVISMGGLVVKRRAFKELEIDVLKLLQKELKFLNSYDEIYGIEGKCFEMFISRLSEVHKFATFFLLPEESLQIFSPSFQEKVLTFKKILTEEMQRRVQFVQDQAGSISYTLNRTETNSVTDEYGEEQDEEFKEERHQSAKKVAERGDYFSEGESDQSQSHSQTKKERVSPTKKGKRATIELLKDLENEEDKILFQEKESPQKQAEAVATIIDDLMKLEVVQEEKEYDDSMSFCSDSSEDEMEYLRYEQRKEDEAEELCEFYNKKISASEVFDDFSMAIVRIPETSFVDILGFFVSDSRFDRSHPLYLEVCLYFKHLELLMINPANKIKLLQVLSVVINCDVDRVDVPGLNRENYPIFIANILKFLQYYTRSNPDVLEIHFERYRSEGFLMMLRKVIKSGDKGRVSVVENLLQTSLASRIISCCRQVPYLDEEENKNSHHGLFWQGYINAGAHIIKLIKGKKIQFNLDQSVINVLGNLFRSKYGLKFAHFRRKLGHIIHYIKSVTINKEELVSIKKDILNDYLVPFAQSLQAKSQQQQHMILIERDNEPFKHLKLTDSLVHLVRILYCPGLEGLSDTLKYFAVHHNVRNQAPNNSVKEAWKAIMSILVNLNSLIEGQIRSFRVFSSVIQHYIYCLIGLSSDLKDCFSVVDEVSKLQELLNFIFEFNQQSICQDHALLESLSKSPLKSLIHFEVKEKILR